MTDQLKIKFDRVSWQQFNLETGQLIISGTQSLSGKTSRLHGPGVNNILISRLKKGETVEIDFPYLNLKAKFIPLRSAW